MLRCTSDLFGTILHYALHYYDNLKLGYSSSLFFFIYCACKVTKTEFIFSDYRNPLDEI